MFQWLGQYDKAKEYFQDALSELKLATEEEKHHVMETLELCFSRSAIRQELKLATEEEKHHVMET